MLIQLKTRKYFLNVREVDTWKILSFWQYHVSQYYDIIKRATVLSHFLLPLDRFVLTG